MTLPDEGLEPAGAGVAYPSGRRAHAWRLIVGLHVEGERISTTRSGAPWTFASVTTFSRSRETKRRSGSTTSEGENTTSYGAMNKRPRSWRLANGAMAAVRFTTTAWCFGFRRRCHVVLPVDQLVAEAVVGERQEVVVGQAAISGACHGYRPRDPRTLAAACQGQPPTRPPSTW